MSSKANGSIPKNELIRKLEAISVLHKKALSIKSKMDNYEPEDNYERKIIVPDFPVVYENDEELNDLKCSVDHEDEDAVEQMADECDSRFAPRKPAEPKKKNFEYETDSSVKNKKEKLGCFSYIAIAISIFFIIGSFVGVDESTKDTLPVIYTIAAIAAAVFVVFKMKLKSLNAEETKREADARADYNSEMERISAEYNDKLKIYEGECASYALRRQDFLDEYSKWRMIYLESVDEENKIEEKLEEDRIAAVKKIEAEEFMPVLQDMAELNDLVTTDYLPAVDIIIDLLKSGRADDLKEAINLYEDIVYRERQLQLEREKEEQRKYEAAMKQEAEERHYMEQMKFQKEQEYHRQREAEKQLQMQADQHKQEMKLQAERLKQEADAAKASRQKRCVWCAHRSTCRQQYYDGAYNCTGFTPAK